MNFLNGFKWPAIVSRIRPVMGTCLILFACNVVQAFALEEAQETLTIDMRNVSIEEVLNEIESQSEYRFLYNKQLVNLNRRVDISVKSDRITDVLNSLFDANDIKYVISDRQIVLSRSERAVALQQQVRTVSGTVTDESGEPVIGANVVQKGTTNGIITDLDGRFSLSIPGSAVLVISYVGYLTQEIQTSGKTSFDIRLVEDSRSLDEVVVVGYGTVRKSDLTGAVAKVSTEDLLQLSTTDIGQALAGRVAGVDVISNSGEPGAGVKIRIRGYGTINNSDPLYVVDGFPTNDLSTVTPQDIESMEILKDASATAIYGSRGANGVVLIQTKKGRYDKKPTFSVNVYGSMSDVIRSIDLLNAWEFATIQQEALTNGGQTISPTTAAQFKYVIDNKLKGTNWEDEVTRTGLTQNYNVSVNGGGDRSAYDIGVTYAGEQGIVKYNERNSLSIRANNTYKLSKNVELGANLTYSRQSRIGATSGNYYGGLWPSVLGAEPLVAAWDSYTDNWGEVLYSEVYNHPARTVYFASSDFQDNISHYFMANTFLQINDIGLKGLSFRTQYGTQAFSASSQTYSPVYYVSSNQQTERSSLMEYRNNFSSWLWNAYFMYNKTSGAHNVGATLGTEIQKTSTKSLNASAQDIPEERNMWYLSQTADRSTYSASSDGSMNSLASFFFRTIYSYADKYLFTGTIRSDGSSKFAEGHKWGYFPSFSLGWNVHEEAFLKESSVGNLFTQLKVRTGWGQVGNEQSAGSNDYIALMTNGYTAAIGNALRDGAIQEMYANTQLSWEAAEQLNLGVDFGIWDMKLSGTIDYFVRTTRDMILATPIPQYAGMTRARTNAGEMRNNGLELSLRWQDRKDKFSYAISGNVSFVKNEILSLGSDDPVYGGDIGRLQAPFTRTEVGREMAYFYGYKTDGLFQTWDEVNAHTYTGADGQQHLIQPNAAPGDVKFLKLSDDGLPLNVDDRTYLGSAMPDMTWGLNLSLGYRNFDLMVFLQGALGYEIANAKVMDLYSSSMVQWNMSKDMMNRWTGSGSTNKYPRVISTDPNENSRFSDRYIEDGTYVRIKNVQLGYSLPNSLISKAKLTRLRFYASVDNLWVFTAYSGFDPEMGDYLANPLNNGIDMVSYPRPRVVTLGLNLTF
ncbi:MAG: TonB-dependent receptor [Tannerellaceae bacterium]|jgi:TonB-linked SusC/RagA family outer membrane protein|nr:TonB-dependent receptor [Tannerellaceae bacterium]